MSETMSESHAVAASMRELANVIDEVADEIEACDMYSRGAISVYADTREHAAALIKALAKSDHVIEVRKEYADSTVTFKAGLKTGGVIYIYGSRDLVCTRKQVGTRTVTKPDPNAPQIEVEEPVYEWDCGSILGD